MAIRREARIDVIAQTKEYQAELAKLPGFTEKQAARAAAQFTKQWQKGQLDAAKAAQKAADDSAEAWKGVFTGQLAADLARDATEAILGYADAVNEARAEQIALSDATGIALETLAGVGAAARRTGIDAAEVTGAFEDFGEVMFDFALNGGGRAAEAFELVGFSSEEMRGRLNDVDGVLRETIELMGDLEDEALKGAAAQQLFGDAGNRLNAILGDGALEEYIELARTTGEVIDEEAVRATREWEAATGDLQAVLKSTGAELVDMLDISPLIRDFTTGLLFVRELVFGVAEEVVESRAKVWRAFDEIAQGNFANAQALLESATGLDRFTESYENVVFRAARATAEFVRGREALEEQGAAADGTSRSLTDLTEVQEQLAKQEEEAVRARDKAAKERERQQREAEKAAADLEALFRRANADLLTELDEIDQARDDELRKLREIEQVLGESAATELARADVFKRAARDRTAVRDEELAKQLEAEQEFASEIEALLVGIAETEASIEEEQRRRRERGLESILDVATEVGDAVVDLIRLQLDGARQLSNELTDILRQQKDERKELSQAIRDATDEDERAQLESQQRILDAEIEANRARRKDARSQARQAFIAQKQFATGIAVINGAAAVLTALAQLGPIAGAIAGVGIAATTAVQVATIQAQEPPQFHTGFAGSSPVPVAAFTRAPDERAASMLPGETVLNQRASDNFGRDNAQRANDVGSVDTRPVFVLDFEGRQVDTMVSRTLERGGTTRRVINDITRSRPTGQVAVVSA